jgi:hypothetical protein
MTARPNGRSFMFINLQGDHRLDVLVYVSDRARQDSRNPRRFGCRVEQGPGHNQDDKLFLAPRKSLEDRLAVSSVFRTRPAVRGP